MPSRASSAKGNTLLVQKHSVQYSPGMKANSSEENLTTPLCKNYTQTQLEDITEQPTTPLKDSKSRKSQESKQNNTPTCTQPQQEDCTVHDEAGSVCCSSSAVTLFPSVPSLTNTLIPHLRQLSIAAWKSILVLLWCRGCLWKPLL